MRVDTLKVVKSVVLAYIGRNRLPGKYLWRNWEGRIRWFSSLLAAPPCCPAIRQNRAISRRFTVHGTDGTDGANAECSPRKMWQGMQNEEFLSAKPAKSAVQSFGSGLPRCEAFAQAVYSTWRTSGLLQGCAVWVQDKRIGAPACSRLSSGFFRGKPSATRRSDSPPSSCQPLLPAPVLFSFCIFHSTFCLPGLCCGRANMDKLLLIDDEADVQYSFRRIFDQPDIELTTADSGEEGLETDPPPQTRPGHHGRAHGRDERPGNAPPPAPDGRQTNGHHDDGLRHDPDGHRGDEAGRLRLSAQTLRRAAAQADRAQRPQGRARHAPGRLLPAVAGIGGLRCGHHRAQRRRCRMFSRSSANWPAATPPR